MLDTIAKQQQQAKPTFEDVIATRASMTEAGRQIAHAFLDYCKANKITYKWSSTNRWRMTAKSKTLGYIAIGRRSKDDNTWGIILELKEFLQYEDYIRKESLAEVIHNNMHYCTQCNSNRCCQHAAKHGCANCTQQHKPCVHMVLGKKFQHLCGICVGFTNPNADALENAIKMLDFWLAIPQGTASRPLFDPATEGLTRIDNKTVSKISDPDGNTNEHMINLFNCKYNSYFYAGHYDYMSIGSSHSVEFELDKPREIAMYSLITGLRLDVPQGWRLYGAEPDGTWTQLDKQHHLPAPIVRYTEKAYAINTPKPYQRYRITLEGTHFVLSQIHLYVTEDMRK